MEALEEEVLRINNEIDEYKERIGDNEKNVFLHQINENYGDSYFDSFEEIRKQLKELPGIGNSPDDNNLKIFLNSLARKLAGQLGVNAQQIMKNAQRKRFKKVYESDFDLENNTQIGGEEVGSSAYLSSRVKDVHDVWIKDTIMNIGLGILTPEQWGRVKTTIKGTKEAGLFRSKYTNSEKENIKNL